MSPYDLEARRLQQTLLQTFNRPAPFEFDSLFDLQRLLYTSFTVDHTWKTFEDRRALVNDAAAFVMEILDNLWTEAGFRVDYIPQAVPTQHGAFLRCGLRADTAMQVTAITPDTGVSGVRYLQFVSLDLFRLVYENPNPLPVLYDHHVDVLAGDFSILPLYVYGVALLNHPWALAERSQVAFAETPYPWREMSEILAGSHRRYHYPEATTGQTPADEVTLDVLSRLFNACVFPPFGYQGEKPGSGAGRNALEVYFSLDDAGRVRLRSAFRRLLDSPNDCLKTIGQVMYFLLGTAEDRDGFSRDLIEGTRQLSPDFDGLVGELSPLLSRHKITAPASDSLALI